MEVAVVGLAYLTQQLLMVGVPVLLAIALRRRWNASWLVLLLGALAWLVSQVVHMPLNAGLGRLGRVEAVHAMFEGHGAVVKAVVLGTTAGLCEEVARWLLLRYATDARGWRAAVTFGVGHGGLESIWFGLVVLSGVVHMAAVARVSPEALAVSPELTALGEQAKAVWSTPAWLPLVSGAERIMAMTCHLALTALVMLSIVRRRTRWLLLAIALHALLDAVGVWLIQTYPKEPWIAELGALAFALASVGCLYACFRALSGANEGGSGQAATPAPQPED